MTDEPTTIVNLRRFPVALHRQAKAQAALEGITLRDLVVRAVSEYLAKVQKPKRGK
jgi:predicted HicB family RNase H-like nuclease